MEVHIVVKGDTLWKIARQYGIPFEDLKRVNAHLANPDYIVPGMKIFLPKKHHNVGHQGTKGEKKEHVKQPEKGKGHAPPHPQPKTEVKPTPKAPTPVSKPKPSAPVPLPKAPTPVSKPKPPAPVPLPKAPTPVPIPITLPPTQMQPPIPAPPAQMPAPMPVPLPMPMPMPMPVQPCQMPTFVQPIIGVPCGWMPIYDADCYPFMHSGQIQAMQCPEVPMHHATPPMQMPLQSTQFPMPELESSVLPVQQPIMDREESPLIEGWKLIESPEFMTTESPGFVMPHAAMYPDEQPVAPSFMFDESPDFDLQPSVPCPPEQSYIPQLISPAAETQWNPAQFGYPMQQPSPPPGCGCGCPGCDEQPAQHHPHHQHQQPFHQPMMVPLYYGQPCGCPTCMQRATHNGMPQHYNGQNWYGAY